MNDDTLRKIRNLTTLRAAQRVLRDVDEMWDTDDARIAWHAIKEAKEKLAQAVLALSRELES